jgi:uncharacterized linocin/CFP29 family protein
MSSGFDFRVVGEAGDELIAKGVTDMMALRPILTGNANIEQMLIGNATLRKDEWEAIDARVNDVFRERLTVADDLRGKGLVTPVSLGTILRITERIDDFSPAQISFDGDTAPQRDRPNFRRDTIPVPVLSHEFSIGWRQLDSSRKRGEALDTTAPELAARKVRDLFQDLITNGYDNGPDGNPIPGLTTAANRRTVSIGTDWDVSGADPVGDVQAMLNEAYGVNLFGPFVLYVPKNYWGPIQSDYTTDAGSGTSSRTVRERIEAFVDVESVRPNDSLADDNVVLVQMTRDVIDLSEAQSVTTVQWQKNPMVTNFRVLMVGGPHIKNSQNSAGTAIHGIVHLS